MMTCIIIFKYLIVCFLLYKHVQICCSQEELIARQSKKKKFVPSNKINRVPPADIYTFPPYKFEGVDYDDESKSMIGRWDLDPNYEKSPTIGYRCMYEYTRCVRTQYFQHWVCAIKKGSYMFYNFLSWCEVEYTNCYMNNSTYYYNGNGYDCNWIYVPVHRGRTTKDPRKLTTTPEPTESL